MDWKCARAEGMLDRRTALQALACLVPAAYVPQPIEAASVRSESVPLAGADLSSRIFELVGRPVSGVVLIGHGDDVAAVVGIGEADPVRQIGNRPETIFDIGSLAKLYTAALVFGLVDAGRLSLDRAIGNYLHGLPGEIGSITLRQCLNHSSGLPNYFRGGDFARKSSDKALEELRSMRLLSPPGAEWSYSNVAYGVLALVVEAETGASFVEEMRSRILWSHELRSTGFFGDFASQGEPIALGFSGRRVFGSPRTWKTPQWGLLGGGGMAASAPDLFKFFRLLVKDRLFSSALHSELVDVRIPMLGKSVNWGAVTDLESAAGLFSFRDAAGRLTFHKGGSSDYGFFSTLIWRPDVDRTAIGLFNSGVRPGFANNDVFDDKAMEHSTLYRRLLSLLDDLRC